MKAGHTADPAGLKDFDARVVIESAKAKEMAAGMDKLHKSQDLYKKSEAIDMFKMLELQKKGSSQLFTTHLTAWQNELKGYDEYASDAIMHMQSIPTQAMGSLP